MGIVYYGSLKYGSFSGGTPCLKMRTHLTQDILSARQLVKTAKGIALTLEQILSLGTDPFSEGVWSAGKETKSKSFLPCKI